MKILFDQGTPVPLREMLSGHTIDTAYDLGWHTLQNGELLANAEQAEFEVLVTTDQNLRYQQNLESRKIAVIVLRSTSWPRIRKQVDIIQNMVDRSKHGDYFEIEIP